MDKNVIDLFLVLELCKQFGDVKKIKQPRKTQKYVSARRSASAVKLPFRTPKAHICKCQTGRECVRKNFSWAEKPKSQVMWSLGMSAIWARLLKSLTNVKIDPTVNANWQKSVLGPRFVFSRMAENWTERRIDDWTGGKTSPWNRCQLNKLRTTLSNFLVDMQNARFPRILQGQLDLLTFERFLSKPQDLIKKECSLQKLRIRSRQQLQA